MSQVYLLRRQFSLRGLHQGDALMGICVTEAEAKAELAKLDASVAMLRGIECRIPNAIDPTSGLPVRLPLPEVLSQLGIDGIRDGFLVASLSGQIALPPEKKIVLTGNN